MSWKTVNISGRILATIGTLIVVMEAVTYYYFIYIRDKHYDVNMTLLLAGVIMGFVGYYVQAPKSAMEAGGFVVSSAEKLIRGRRRDDADVTIAQKTTVIQPKEPDVRD